MENKHSFSRHRRLTKTGKLLPALAFDRRIPGDHIMVLARLNGSENCRLGLAVGKRIIPRAVHRNYLKRKIREAFRLHQHELSGLDIVVKVNRPPRDTRQFDSELTAVFRRLHRCLE